MEKIWSCREHISTNFWYDIGNKTCKGPELWNLPGENKLRLDKKLLSEYISDLKKAGCNSIMLDLGDAIKYKSHPEIAVEDAYSIEEIKKLFKEIKDQGLEIIPKLNFSATHDIWLKEYSRMLGTSTYRQVVKDIIDEVCELLHPKYMHIGMDEETFEHQKNYDYVVVRQHDEWWNDFLHIVSCVEKNGARAIMWSDLAREHADVVIEKCPKSVIQCVWYYSTNFDEPWNDFERIRIRPFKQLLEAGFDVVAGGGTCYYDDNLIAHAKYAKKELNSDKFLGFIETTWYPVLEDSKKDIYKAVKEIKQARDYYDN